MVFDVIVVLSRRLVSNGKPHRFFYSAVYETVPRENSKFKPVSARLPVCDRRLYIFKSWVKKNGVKPDIKERKQKKKNTTPSLKMSLKKKENTNKQNILGRETSAIRLFIHSSRTAHSSQIQQTSCIFNLPSCDRSENVACEQSDTTNAGTR
jgi:hypothetical protein